MGGEESASMEIFMNEIDVPAFPFSGYPGMTLRDYFAGQALLGMNANPELMEIVTAGSILDGSTFERLGQKAYEQADAMLEEKVK
jgi:hypothetical protein